VETARLVELAKVDLAELPTSSSLTSAPKSMPFVAADSCAGCHPGQSAQWKQTPHATAWNTLVAENRHTDLDCFGCHATGAMHPEGPTTPAEVGSLGGVQCEACHGPGRDHVAAPSAQNVVKVPEEALCTDCHDGVRDEGRYEHAAYLERVRH
jgi:predicted CXXCH cytochrome family protein